MFGMLNGRVPAVFFSENCGFSVVQQGKFTVFLIGSLAFLVSKYNLILFCFVRCFNELGDLLRYEIRDSRFEIRDSRVRDTRCLGSLESTLVVGGLHGWGENLWPRIPRCPAPYLLCFFLLGCVV